MSLLVVHTAARADSANEECGNNQDITVVVDFQELIDGNNDDVNVRCAPQPVDSGLDALKRANISYTIAVPPQGGGAFVCRIAGLPTADDEPCNRYPPASAYWVYWYAERGGQWTYSDEGAATRTPPPGSIEGWSFAKNRTAGQLPPPRYPVPKPIPSATPTTAATPAPAPGATSPTPTPAVTTRASRSTSSTAPAASTTTTTATTLVDAVFTVASSTSIPLGNVDLSVDQSDDGSPLAFVLGVGAVVLVGAAGVAMAMTRRRARVNLPRELHPGAWWLWALGLAVAVSRTTNPLLLALVLVVVFTVTSARGNADRIREALRGYLIIALVVIAIRVGFRMLLDANTGEHVLFRLPEIPLPASSGIRLGGAVSLEGLLGAVYDGLRLATLLVCLGAANVLANPKRLIKAAPAALHEVGVAVTVAVTVAPQLIDSARRVRRARRLRSGSGKGVHLIRQVLIPVLTDALDRSLLLAAAMDTRGHGRTTDLPDRARRLSGALVLIGLCGVCVGTYGLLDGSVSRWLGAPAMVLGVGLSGLGVAFGGRRVKTTVYRPDPWRQPEWLVAASGVVVAIGLFVSAQVEASTLNPSTQPLHWPALPALAALVVLVAALPAFLTPVRA